MLVLVSMGFYGRSTYEEALTYYDFFCFIGAVISEDKVRIIGDLIESWFIFSLIWTIGATCDRDGRVLFEKYVRGVMEEEEFMLMFPLEGSVYDYRLDDAGTSLIEKDDEGWVVIRKGPVRWVTWTHDLPPHKVSTSVTYVIYGLITDCLFFVLHIMFLYGHNTFW